MKTVGTGTRHLGDCRIQYGKWPRNNFIYFSSSRSIHIDFDSDYYLIYQVKLKNPQKALAKAEKIVLDFIDKDVTIEELVKAGFEHDIPEKLLKRE